MQPAARPGQEGAAAPVAAVVNASTPPTPRGDGSGGFAALPSPQDSGTAPPDELRAEGPTDIAVDVLTATYRPGSPPPRPGMLWTWDDEERDILARVCLCCGEPGHYQRQLEAHVAEHGFTGLGVCLGTDGRVWDGHHRIVAARRLGIERIPLESAGDAEERWLRDHGEVGWPDRTFGDER